MLVHFLSLTMQLFLIFFKFACDVLDTSATHAHLVHDVTCPPFP